MCFVFDESLIIFWEDVIFNLSKFFLLFPIFPLLPVYIVGTYGDERKRTVTPRIHKF